VAFDLTPTAAQHDLIRPIAFHYDQRREYPRPVPEKAAQCGCYGALCHRDLIGEPTGLSLPMFMPELFRGSAADTGWRSSCRRSPCRPVGARRGRARPPGAPIQTVGGWGYITERHVSGYGRDCPEYGYPTRDEMPVDKTGAHAAISTGDGLYTIAVAGRVVGHASYTDRGDQRVFDHTEIHPEFGGRGLATLLVEEALNDARDAGKRIVPVCSMIGTVLHKHAEFDDITDPVTEDILQWLRTTSSS